MATTTFSPSTNYQLQSPLFGVLPAEIRNEIFALALMPFENEEETYPEDSYWYRPGFSAPSRSDSALLRTCKVAYAEGQKVFFRDLEWPFWFDRGPEGRSGNHACMKFFRSLDQQAVKALQKVRFFTQMYWLEAGHELLTLFRVPQFRPTQITITIRYSDWWWWENDEPLMMEDGWLRTFNGTPGLRELRVEYETRTPKKDEMMQIVQRNKKFKLPVRREGGGLDDWEGYLSAEDTKLKEWKWNGTSKLGGQSWNHLAKSDTVEYVVVTDTWRFVREQLTLEELGRSPMKEQYQEFDEDELDNYGDEHGDFEDGWLPPSGDNSDEDDSEEESEDDEDESENESGEDGEAMSGYHEEENEDDIHDEN